MKIVATGWQHQSKRVAIVAFEAFVRYIKFPVLKVTMRTPTDPEGTDVAEGNDKMGKSVDVLNLTRNSISCSHQFGNEQINIDRDTIGDPVYFFWDHWRKP